MGARTLLHSQLPGAFAVSPGSYMAPWYMPPGGMATAAAAAAAPAPAVQPARSYLVFFDWDKATLTDRARQIIKEAADNSTHVQYTRINVNGYTDTSGTPQYNMGLSIRRADTVKSELVRDGVPATAITTQGFGETHLLCPPALACASRRTAGWRSSSTNRSNRRSGLTERGASWRPASFARLAVARAVSLP